MPPKSLEDPADIPIKIRNGRMVIRMFLIGDLGSPLLWRIKRLVWCVVGLVQEPGTTSICLDEANTLIGLHVRSVWGLVRLTNPVPQKRIEGFEGVEESGVAWS